MKRVGCFGFGVFTVLFILGTLNVVFAFEVRTWTSSTGSAVEAEFVRREGSLVIIKKADGGLSRIPYVRLSVVDQQYVTGMTKPGAAFGKGRSEVPEALEELFGETLFNAKKEDVFTATLEGKVIGLYFSASWCPPCRRFTPSLVRMYNKLKKSGKPFEVVFISSDESKKSAFSYMTGYAMPWLTVKYGSREHRALKERYGSTGIPFLAIIDDEGEVLSRRGRKDVSSLGVKAFEKWK